MAEVTSSSLVGSTLFSHRSEGRLRPQLTYLRERPTHRPDLANNPAMPVQSRARQNDHFPDRAGHAHRANRIARTLYVVYPTEVWYCTEAPAHTVWAGPDLARVETEDAVDERGVRDARNTRGQRRSEARPSEDGPSLVVLSGAPLADRSGVAVAAMTAFDRG